MVYQQSCLNCNPQFQFVITDVPITVNKEKYHIYRLEWHLLHVVTTHLRVTTSSCYSNTETDVETFKRVEANFAALQTALKEIQADNSDKV